MSWLEELAEAAEASVRSTPDELLSPAGRILKATPSRRRRPPTLTAIEGSAQETDGPRHHQPSLMNDVGV